MIDEGTVLGTSVLKVNAKDEDRRVLFLDLSTHRINGEIKLDFPYCSDLSLYYIAFPGSLQCSEI